MKHELIESNPNILGGKPILAGTRISVELPLERMAAGETIDHLPEANPHVAAAPIPAALAFAAEMIRADAAYPFGPAAE
jgi:uncharacterized protein (DUF433 family)